ncbi:hypothetical protein GCM10010912_17820 [Paenibacillus albidus]|uniref:Uncharacterized protein n=1 Tax=Paenibacillus albidus TaxID=2041023 RepID=A0A917FFJ5_9BACL|nr:hypothetical protein [Paenibacillus albidus]GGF73058.1 hypothetical protein GCM10010912_17820 [Paenibacillus albidus]
MPKLIDADRLLQYLNEQAEAWRPTQSYYQLKGVIDQVESGTFDPTPVQPDTPKIAPEDGVYHKRYKASGTVKRLSDSHMRALVEWHDGASPSYVSINSLVKIKDVEVIPNGD